ncbi:ribose-phosphate diphosphokinase [Halocatena pleomorpha]|uniref:ribose-phosphate diphosphokinase n=1 Tax=Halocatena pleomorpha TaxID=1785090 RepID=A0A3P3RF56_9EURY|nr:ribose-phosphate diphosphokinase [Halocatena pleomorpha]RRJ31053.1 ribose-phosphate diphosphokinase [Halocatena pleomorpha]
MILPGSTAQSLAAALAAQTNDSLAVPQTTRFADGEFKVRVASKDDRAVIVCSTVSAESHIELLQLQEIASQFAEEVITVLPYMGYARQDAAFTAGEPVSARAVAQAISTNTDRVLTVTPHETHVRDFFGVPCDIIDGAHLLADPLPDNLTKPLFLAPDEGATDLAGTVRDAYGAGETDYFEKTRDRDTGAVELKPSETDVTGRDVIVTDDIIATGSTMSKAIDHLRADSVARVFAVCVHPMLAGNAQTKLADAGVEAVFGTDTIERSATTVSVAPAIADAL